MGEALGARYWGSWMVAAVDQGISSLAIHPRCCGRAARRSRGPTGLRVLLVTGQGAVTSSGDAFWIRALTSETAPSHRRVAIDRFK
jgi:hypothetical protein